MRNIHQDIIQSFKNCIKEKNEGHLKIKQNFSFLKKKEISFVSLIQNQFGYKSSVK
jgi:hypothetical protein